MGKRILVADDSLTIQRAFAMVLGGQDYALMSARSVDEALAAAKGSRPDLIIADAVLGTGSGYDLCASVKADPALRGVPVHILASNQNPLDEARARRVGADGHLLKPFDSQVLLDSVTAALVASARPVPAPVAEAPVAAEPRAAAASPWAEQVDIEEGVAAPEDDSYGEFTIERGSAAGPAAWSARPPTWPGSRPAPVFSHPAPGAPVARPSLIPGVVPPTPVSPTRPAPPLPEITSAQPGEARPAARTIMGFPSVGGPSQFPASPAAPPAAARPSVPRPSVPPPAAVPRIAPPVPVAPAPTPPGAAPLQAPVRRSASMPIVAPSAPPPVSAAPTPVPPTAAVSPAPVRRSTGMPVVTPPPASAPLAAAVSSAIDQKVAVIAARGREYEAIAKLSREIIEQVVWEVVPELAEAIIKQEIDRLVTAKR